jgi:class 3 adenylate cyclase/CheY-like chemotaxis protein
MAERKLTFLFTDVEDSTGLVCSLGNERFGAVLAVSRAIVRRAVESAGGNVVEARADETFAVFEDPEAAVDAAIAAQRCLDERCWPAGAGVRVRMGLHTGIAREDGRNLIGLDVHRASRISNAGHGGQILVSADTAELVNAPLAELGEYTLHGLSDRERIFQVVAEGLDHDFPCLRNAIPRGVSVVLADDSVLVREGIARVLVESGMEIVAQVGNADDLLDAVEEHRPAVAIVDIRMPPGETGGMIAAKELRDAHPDTAVLLLSQSLEPAYATELRDGAESGVGYLLKDRVADLDRFAQAVLRIAEGEQVFDPLLTADAVPA